MKYPLVLDLAADGIPVAVTCRVLGFSKQVLLQVAQKPCHTTRLGRRTSDQRRPRNPWRRPRVRVPVHRRRAPRQGHHRGREPGRETVFSQEQIWSIHSKKRGLNRKAGPPVHDDLVQKVVHRPGAEPGLADRYHRTRHRRGQAVSVRDQGRLLQPDRRLLHRLANESILGGGGPAQRDRTANAAGRPDRSQRSRQPVPVQEVRPRPQSPPAARLDGPSRSLRRQRRHGILLRPAPKERPGPATLDQPSPTTAGDRLLDRNQLPPSAADNAAWANSHPSSLR